MDYDEKRPLPLWNKTFRRSPSLVVADIPYIPSALLKMDGGGGEGSGGKKKTGLKCLMTQRSNIFVVEDARPIAAIDRNKRNV